MWGWSRIGRHAREQLPTLRGAAWLCTLACLTAALPAGAQAQPPISGASVADPNASAEYRIKAGDELDVSVWGEERMQRTVRVLSDGTFTFPLAGTIPAAGQTVQQVSAAIKDRIAGNYRTAVPDVTVGVRTAASMSFYVVGKVRTPGTYATGTSVNVVQALSMAGGLADFADVKNAVILRQTPGGQVVEPIKLAHILKGGRRLDAGVLAEALPVLRSGDVLVIP
jgi:polysaccharide biosynthesis/export protein